MDVRFSAECSEVAQKSYNQLLPNEKAILTHFESDDTIERYVRRLIRNDQATPLVKVQARIDKILRLMKPISMSFENGAYVLYSPSKFLWGIFGSVIDLIRRDADVLDFTLRMFDDLLGTLPRNQSYTAIISESPDLQLAISDFYQEFVRLGVRAVKTFGRGTASIITRLKWKRDQKEFTLALRKLKRSKEKLDLEVGNANSAQIERRYREVLAGRANPPSDTQSSRRSFDVGQRVFSVPYPRNNRFYGRDELLSEMHKNLQAGGEASTTTKFLALCGLGGSGKTQLALEYVYRHRKDYDACLWISCDTPIKAAQGFVDVARKLAFDNVQQQHLRALVKDWLCDTCKKWLIVFDNAEDQKLVADLWPPAAHGSVLLTSQNQGWLSADSLTHGRRIDSFSQSDGEGMLQQIFKNHGRTIQQSANKRIVKALGALPLAIFQIGSYLVATHSTPESFLERYLNPSTAANVNSWDEAMPLNYQHTLSTVWKLGFDELPQNSMLLINVMALLDSDRIPYTLFQSGPSDTPFDESSVLEDAMRYLRRYSFVAHVAGEGSSQLCSIHRQVQLYTQSRLDAPTFQQCFEVAVSLLRHQFPHRSPFAEPFDPFNEKWQPAESWISHLVSVKNAVGNFKNRIKVSTVYLSLLLDGSIYLWERGFLDQGSELNSAAQELCKDGEASLLVEEIQCFYACILSNLGDLDRAEELFDEQVVQKKNRMAIRRQSHVRVSMDDELLLANAYNNLAGIRCAQGRYNEAELNNILSLGLKERWKDDRNMDSLFILSYSNLGNLYGRQGRWEDSAQNFEKALDLGRKTEWTLRHALTAHNYGCMRLAEGEVLKARDLLIAAFQMRSGKMGDHYETASTLHMLAKCYCATGELENARDILKEALRMLEGYGNQRDINRIVRSKYELARVLDQMRDPSAERFRAEANELSQTISGTDLADENGYDDLVAYT